MACVSRAESGPSLGNSAFTAVFDAAIGERITAVSSAIDCNLDVDETTRHWASPEALPSG
jgi:hypothetical protein